MYEAGLDPDNLSKQPKMIVHELMIYQVLDKKHLELNDLAAGNMKRGLHFQILYFNYSVMLVECVLWWIPD